MLDHLFLDTVGALRAALDQSLLEPAGQDDRLVYDLLTGDLVWEATVSLPGDGDPPRVSADISLDWQTWSQSAWRSMSMGEQVEEPPEIGIEVVFRVQRLATRPALAAVLAVLPEESPDIDGDNLARSAPVIEEAYEDEGAPSRGGHRGVVRGQLPTAHPERQRCQRAEPFPRAGRVVARRARCSPVALRCHQASERRDRGQP